MRQLFGNGCAGTRESLRGRRSTSRASEAASSLVACCEVVWRGSRDSLLEVSVSSRELIVIAGLVCYKNMPITTLIEARK